MIYNMRLDVIWLYSNVERGSYLATLVGTMLYTLGVSEAVAETLEDD